MSRRRDVGRIEQDKGIPTPADLNSVLHRAAVNILGNALATIVIGQWEGAVDRKLLVAGLAEVNVMRGASSPILKS